MAKRARAATVDIGLRVKEPLRARIEKAAKGRGVSMNAEINSRLEQSFDRDQEIQHLFGNEPVFVLMKMLASAMNLTGEFVNVGMSRDHWIWNPVAYDEAVKAAHRILGAMRPDREGRRPPHIRERTGEKIAQLVLDKISED